MDIYCKEPHTSTAMVCVCLTWTQALMAFGTPAAALALPFQRPVALRSCPRWLTGVCRAPAAWRSGAQHSTAAAPGMRPPASHASKRCLPTAATFACNIAPLCQATGHSTHGQPCLSQRNNGCTIVGASPWQNLPVAGEDRSASRWSSPYLTQCCAHSKASTPCSAPATTA